MAPSAAASRSATAGAEGKISSKRRVRRAGTAGIRSSRRFLCRAACAPTNSARRCRNVSASSAAISSRSVSWLPCCDTNRSMALARASRSAPTSSRNSASSSAAMTPDWSFADSTDRPSRISPAAFCSRVSTPPLISCFTRRVSVNSISALLILLSFPFGLAANRRESHFPRRSWAFANRAVSPPGTIVSNRSEACV